MRYQNRVLIVMKYIQIFNIKNKTTYYNLIVKKIHMRQFTSILYRNASIFCTYRRVGQSMYVPQIPTFQINPKVLRPAHPSDKDLTFDEFESFSKLQRSHKQIPQCRYYAVEHKNRIYHVFNAYCYPMGRMINKIATSIRGKNSPLYKNSIANVKNGDVCVIVNALDPLLTGKKLKYKQLKYHTNFVGHLKTFSYKSVLNKKPQLLYYYLLRKAMPKNKLSEKYLENVKIYRGPNHDIKGLPQFLPPKQMKTPLAHVNLEEYIKQNQNVQLVYETQKGLAEEVMNRKFENVKYPLPKDTLETDQGVNTKIQKKKVSAYSSQEAEKIIRRQNKIIERFRTERAPYKKKSQPELGYQYFKDQRKAKKSPYYAELADEDMVEDDDYKIDDPLFRKDWEKKQ